MFSFFSRLPIRLKLVSFFCLVFLLSAVFNFLYYPKVYKEQSLYNMKHAIRSLAETVALATGISMELMDFASVQIAIEWAKQDKRLEYLGIYDTSNDVVGVYNPRSMAFDAPDLLNSKGFFEIQGNVGIIVPIKYREVTHGKALVVFSLDELNASVRENRLTTFYVSLGILLFGIIISLILSNMISKPVVRLTDIALDVSKGNYDVIIKVESEDEVGKLSRAFQVMVEKINLAMFENKLINRQLEYVIDGLTDMGTKVAAERDFERLMELILAKACSFTNADGGTMYMVNGDHLVFKIIQNDTLGIKMGGRLGDKIPFPPVKIIESNVSGYVALKKTYLNIPDVYFCEDFDFSGPKKFDQANGYRSKSMLVVPLLNLENQTVGVLQLLNSKDQDTGQIVPFPSDKESLVHSLASQAAVSITNLLLKEKTDKLLDEVIHIKNYNEGILESMTNGVITLDSGKKIIKCNGPSLRILSFNSEHLINRPLESVLSTKKNMLMDYVARTLESGKSQSIQNMELPGLNNTLIPVNMILNPLYDVKGNLIGAMMIFEDITAEKKMKTTLARFMTKEVADQLMESGEAILGGQSQEAAVMFSDIRNFTTISEHLSAQETVAMLNEYFDLMVEIIFDHHGILDKYIGDAILAVFGVPFKGPSDSDNAILTAVKMISTLKDLNSKRVRQNKAPLAIGVGINTEAVLAGTIGCLKRMDYTIMGDGVNIASRLESANKYYGTQILISGNTYTKAKNKFMCREIDWIRLKGKRKVISIYEVMDYHDEESFPRLEFCVDVFHDGLLYYRQRDWDMGIKMFKEVLAINPRDKVSKIFLERCETMKTNPPDDSWSGVWFMDTK